MPTSPLPDLDPAAALHARRVAEHLHTVIRAAGGWLPFEAWMEHALYAPGLGYYAAGSVKLADAGAPGTPGDFVTAPELTPLFGHTVARQVAEVLCDAEAGEILEFGAGTGALAESILDAFDAMETSVSGTRPTPLARPGDAGLPPQLAAAKGTADRPRYSILELSADLRARQKQRLARFGDRVQWLDALPDSFAGCVIANEVLDAMPVTMFRWNEAGSPMVRGVALSADGGFVWSDRPADAALARRLAARMPPLPGYVSELNLRAEAWTAGMGGWLARGAALLFDYGFPRGEYYHPQRAGGTLMCHYRHRSHADPLLLPGLQDITAHVDFTAIADAALQGGLDVLGYTSQARFLMNAGLPGLLATLDPSDVRAYARVAGTVQKLLSEAEMGELFKVLAVGRGIARPLSGFARGDRRGALSRR
jgi:SAM-dependent MidA family methyltransferase